MSLTVHDSTEIAVAVEQSVSGVLETMFFTGIFGPADPEAAWPEGSVHVRITFSGDCNGEFSLRLSEEAIRELAAAFLGVDLTEATPEGLAEVSAELANMICGSTLSGLPGIDNLKLSSPYACLGDEARPASDPHQPHFGRCIEQRFELPGGLLAVSFRFHKDPAV